MAIRCIQKNINKYMKVKTWPWWKLYTRVLPLLDVHRTDEELKTRAVRLPAEFFIHFLASIHISKYRHSTVCIGFAKK
jgi:hypothetical protein